MIFFHPAFLAISLISAFTYSVKLKGKKAVKFALTFALPMVIITALINPLFNHYGITALFALPGGNMVTLEAIIYGLALGIILAAMMMWFSCYNAIVTSDKFIFLFGRVIPSLSLIFSMALGFVSRFKTQIKIIANAQKCLGRDISQGKTRAKIKQGITIISILITWALENAIDTSDSMHARGYGLKGRTAFSIYNFFGRDKYIFIVMLLLLAIIIFGVVMGAADVLYNPIIAVPPIKPFYLLAYLAYAVLCLLPFCLDLTEDIKWNALQSKI